LVEFQCCRGVVCDLNSGRQTVKNPIPPENRMRLGRDQNSGLSIAENIVLLENSFASIENADATISSVEDFIPLWVTSSLESNLPAIHPK
jgi:hypothetical protein